MSAPPKTMSTVWFITGSSPGFKVGLSSRPRSKQDISGCGYDPENHFIRGRVAEAMI